MKVKIYLSGPDIFYKDAGNIFSNKIASIKKILEPKYECIILNPLDVSLDFSCAKNYWNCLADKSKYNKCCNISDEDKSKFDELSYYISSQDRALIDKFLEDENTLCVSLTNIDPYPLQSSVGADTGTIYELGYAEGLMKFRKNIYTMAYYTKETDLLENRISSSFGGYTSVKGVSDDGLVTDNGNFVPLYSFENSMVQFAESYGRLKKLGIEFLHKDIESAIKSILKLADQYYK